jgi:uncharacterized membrane protein
MEISPKRLVVALGLVFVLGVLFAVTNSYYIEEEGSALPVITYGISFISVLIGAGIVLLFQWRITRRQIEKILKVLPGEERRVVQLLMDNGNSLEQNRLVALSGYNKVKVSRIVKALEQRGVAKKTRLGNTNLIVLDI